MGIEPTGSRVELREVSIVELKDGQIVGITAYFDGASLRPPDPHAAAGRLRRGQAP